MRVDRRILSRSRLNVCLPGPPSKHKKQRQKWKYMTRGSVEWLVTQARTYLILTWHRCYRHLCVFLVGQLLGTRWSSMRRSCCQPNCRVCLGSWQLWALRAIEHDIDHARQSEWDCIDKHADQWRRRFWFSLQHFSLRLFYNERRKVVTLTSIKRWKIIL